MPSSPIGLPKMDKIVLIKRQTVFKKHTSAKMLKLNIPYSIIQLSFISKLYKCLSNIHPTLLHLKHSGAIGKI